MLATFAGTVIPVINNGKEALYYDKNACGQMRGRLHYGRVYNSAFGPKGGWDIANSDAFKKPYTRWSYQVCVLFVTNKFCMIADVISQRST